MINPENILHVVPIDDIENHLLECEFPVIGEPFCKCKCEPKYQGHADENIYYGFLVIHNSFDGREGIEWVNEILNT